jgi:hypothetical protein
MTGAASSAASRTSTSTWRTSTTACAQQKGTGQWTLLDELMSLMRTGQRCGQALKAHRSTDGQHAGSWDNAQPIYPFTNRLGRKRRAGSVFTAQGYAKEQCAVLCNVMCECWRQP